MHTGQHGPANVQTATHTATCVIHPVHNRRFASCTWATLACQCTHTATHTATYFCQAHGTHLPQHDDFRLEQQVDRVQVHLGGVRKRKKTGGKNEEVVGVPGEPPAGRVQAGGLSHDCMRAYHDGVVGVGDVRAHVAPVRGHLQSMGETGFCSMSGIGFRVLKHDKRGSHRRSERGRHHVTTSTDVSTLRVKQGAMGVPRRSTHL